MLNNINNPSKEILASSGIYDGKAYANPVYYSDLPNSLIPNTGIQTTTTSTTTTTNPSGSSGPSGINSLPLGSGRYVTGDMLVFNPYIHYDTKNSIPLKTFNPQSFLQQSIVTFNAYSLESRS